MVLLALLAACQVYTTELLLPAPPADGGSDGAGGSAGSELPPRTLWATSFEPGEPAFELAAGPGELTGAPPGIDPRTGKAALSASVITPDFDFLTIWSGCLPINISDEVTARAWGIAGPDNGGNAIWLRIVILWHADTACTSAPETLAGSSEELPSDSYEEVIAVGSPPPETTALRLRLDVRDEPGEWPGESWAVDDVSLTH